MAATCLCPKACGAIHYKASMSYAAANQNSQNRIDLSARFLNKVGKNLNKSLNTQERLLPHRREANIDEAGRVLSGLTKIESDDLIDNLEGMLSFSAKYVTRLFFDSYHAIMTLGFQKMQDVLHDYFIVCWDEMNLYDCMSGSFELSKILRDSIDLTEQTTWRAAIRLRLEEKLIASKRALYNLKRVHDAYCNVVPLLNYTDTPNGRYDSFYLTAELFKQSTKINETYTRLIGHIKQYIETIDGLLCMHKNGCHIIINKFLSYCNGFWQASVEYAKDLRLYDTPVIRQPLHRIIRARDTFEDHNVRGTAKIVQLQSSLTYITYTFRKGISYMIEFNSTGTVGAIEAYLHNLKNEGNASRIFLADVLTSDRITQLVGDVKDLGLRTKEIIFKYMIDYTHIVQLNCLCAVDAAAEPLLRVFYAKLYDHYKITTGSEKDAMREYFMIKDDTSAYAKLVRGEINGTDCVDNPYDPPHSEYSISLRNLTKFKNSLDSFLKKTRLDGTFYRYVPPVLLNADKHPHTHTTHAHTHPHERIHPRTRKQTFPYLSIKHFTLLAFTQSVDKLFHSYMVFCENECFLISNLRCSFINVTL